MPLTLETHPLLNAASRNLSEVEPGSDYPDNTREHCHHNLPLQNKTRTKQFSHNQKNRIRQFFLG